MKRFLLFLGVNLAIMATLYIVTTLLLVFVPGMRHGFYGPLMVICFVWGIGFSLLFLQVSRWFAKWSHGIQLIDGASGDSTLDWVHEATLRLARQAGLPEPEIGVYDNDEVNAFVTGPSKGRALVAISSGMLRTLDRRELEGVLGHEISHIASGDMVTMALIQGVVDAFVMFFARIVAWGVRNAMRDENGNESGFAFIVDFAVYFALTIVFGSLGSFITCWYSRRTQLEADVGSAHLVGTDKMIADLRKLQTFHEAIDSSDRTFVTLKIAGGQSAFAPFSTHPPVEARIAALEALTAPGGAALR